MGKHDSPLTLWTITALALTLAVPTLSHAAVPSVMNFQAILLDDQGQIVADSTYEIEFGIYPASMGIPALWQEVQSVTTDGGLFNAMLGITTPLTSEVFSGEAWLQMRLTASPEPYLPRTRIGATPYAYAVQSLDQSKGGQVSGKLIVDTIVLGRSGVPGRLSVIQSNATDGAVFQPYGSHGTSLRINDEAGNPSVQLRPDNSGEGGWLYVHRNAAGAAGFTVEGNTVGTFEPSVRISGSTQSMEFDLTQTGSASVALTPDAIDASEVLDEPGVASNVGTNLVIIGSSPTNLLSRAIVAPADGYVFVTGTVELYTQYRADSVSIGLANDPVDWPVSQRFLNTFDTSAESLNSRTVTVNAVFPVTAGVDTYYLRIGKLSSEPLAALNRQLSVLYFPTSYGTVVEPSAERTVTVSTTFDEETEQTAAENANRERMRKELDQMKARLLELEKSMTEQESDNPQR